MANPNAIASALAAQNAALQTTVAGQSPLITGYNQWIAGAPAAPGLPRPIQDFLTGAFGPLNPIQPMPVDEPDKDTGRPEPRRWQYPIGWNLPVGQPGTEGYRLTTFPVMRRLADGYSVVRSMLNIRKNEMSGLTWDVGPTADAQSVTKGDKGAVKDQRARAGQIVKWFKRVDSNYNGFQSWFEALLEEQYVIDAVAVHRLPTRVVGKGLFGSGLAELEALNGETIRPLLDIRGASPRPPAPAYQQYLWGVPRSDLMTIMREGDIERLKEELGDDVDPDDEYRQDQLLYLPRTKRVWTPYGFSPIEMALLPISIGLQRQGFLLDYFQEGSIPGVYVIAGDAYVTPTQQRQLQDNLNAIAGDIAWKHRVIVLPPGSKTDPQKDLSWQQQVDQTIVEQVAMILHIQPHEIGMVPGGRSSGLGGRGMVEGQQEAASEQRTEPDRKWWKATLFDWVIQEVFRQDDLEWKWLDFEEQEDESQKATAQHAYITMGKTTIDEERIEDGLDPFNLPLTKTPWVMGGTGGIIPLDPSVPAPAPPAPALPPGMPGQEPPGAAPGGPGRGGPPFGGKPGGQGQPPAGGQPARPAPFGGRPAAPPAQQPPAQPAAAKRFGQDQKPGGQQQDVEPVPTNPDGTPMTYPDGTPAAYGPDGTIAEPASGILFSDDEIDGLLDLTEDEVGALLDETDDVPEPVAEPPADAKKAAAAPAGTPAVPPARAAAPRPKTARGLNPAYTTTATNDDVRTEVTAIRGRVESRGGGPVTSTPVVAAFERNLGRKVRAAIVALAVKKYGKVPSRAATDATEVAWADRWLDKFVEAAKRELRPHDHASHADGLAHERHLAQMHADHVSRAQDQRLGGDRRATTEDRRQRNYKVQYNRRSGDDRRSADRRTTGPAAARPAATKGLTVADLVKGRVSYKDSKLPAIVHDYLLRSYPPKDVEWTLDPEIEWEYEPHVKLSDINMARRPGGRDPSKVEAISGSLKAGASMDPMVFVDVDNPNGLVIADGWHRTLGAEDAGWEDVPAFVGHHVPDKYVDTITGAMQADSDSKKKAAIAELATLRRFLGKGGKLAEFRTSSIDSDVMRLLRAEAEVGERGPALERARERILKGPGNPDALREWYNAGADGQIDWGDPGDFDQCVGVASGYMSDEDAKGFCNLRHQDAVGGAPGTEKVAGAKLAKADRRVRYRASSAAGELCGLCRYMVGSDCQLVAGTIEPDDVCDLFEPGSRPAAKTISLSSPLSTGIAPYDLAGAAPSPGDPPVGDRPAARCRICDTPLMTDVERASGVCGATHEVQAEPAPAATLKLLAAVEAELTRRGVDLAKWEYSPDQPRGDGGKWVAGGDTGSGDQPGSTVTATGPSDSSAPTSHAPAAPTASGGASAAQYVDGPPTAADRAVLAALGSGSAKPKKHKAGRKPRHSKARRARGSRTGVHRTKKLPPPTTVTAKPGGKPTPAPSSKQGPKKLGPGWRYRDRAGKFARQPDAEKFSADEARDSGGRWTSGDVSGDVASAAQAGAAAGGFTIHPARGSAPSSGYQVAIAGRTALHDASILKDHAALTSAILDYVRSNADALKAGGRFYIGGWVNEGKLYLDVSEHVETRADALRLGAERNQIAVWDNVAGREIPTGGTGT